jgi:DNA-binding MarR family transcriptional regulator
MKAPLDRLAAHLNETLGVTIAPTHWAGAGGLPPFLQDRYDFFEAQLLDEPCLFLVSRDEREEPPATIRKHIDHVRTKWDGPAVYVRQRVTAYNRKRLIEHKVPFVVPGNQMYLPTLGIDLREHFRKLQADRPRFRPSAQAVLIHMLLSDEDDFGPAELAPMLGYSAMTISRALDEVEAAELAESYPAGRERRLRLKAPKREIWRTAQPHLRDPVHSRHWARIGDRQELPGPRAGLTALAHYSMLAEPSNLIVAVSRDAWRSLHEQDALMEAAAREPDALNLEVWNYPPTLFTDGELVDRLSLYLSLRETNDERIEAALEHMMGGSLW